MKLEALEDAFHAAELGLSQEADIPLSQPSLISDKDQNKENRPPTAQQRHQQSQQPFDAFKSSPSLSQRSNRSSPALTKEEIMRFCVQFESVYISEYVCS
jgi:hypothetical protein